MNRLSLELVRSLKAMEQNLGNPFFIWRGTAYPCAPSSADTTAPLVLLVRKEVLPKGFPKKEQVFTYTAIDFQIQRVAPMHGGEIIVIAAAPVRTAPAG